MAAVEIANGVGEERRSAPRVPVDVDVTMRHGDASFSAMARDLSTSGIFLSAMVTLPVGTPVGLRFHLPEGLVICDGVVRRVCPAGEGSTAGMGISFDHLSELDRELIESACQDPAPRVSGVSHRRVT